MNNKTKVSISLLIASLILLIIYGADEATESREKISAHAEHSEANESPEERAAEQGKVETRKNTNETSSRNIESTEAGEKHEERKGFLPLTEAVRGSVFGGGAMAMSIIGFVISRREYSPVVSALLLINGAALIAIIMTEFLNGTASSELLEGGNSSGEFVIIGSAIAVGALVLIGLGILKLTTNRKIIKK